MKPQYKTTTEIKRIMHELELNKYESMIINELIKEDVLTAGQIHKNGGVPRSRIYDVAEELERKGYVIIIKRDVGNTPLKIHLLSFDKIKKAMEKNIELEMNHIYKDINRKVKVLEHLKVQEIRRQKK